MDMLRSEQQLDLAELPHIDEANYTEPDLPSIFSDEHFKSTLTTSLTDSKIDSRVRTSRVIQDAMMPIEARAANAAFLDPGGHISRAKGITINGDVKVKPEKIMYIRPGDTSKVDYAEYMKQYNSHKTILNPEWDHNFVADGALSPEKFKQIPTSHRLKQEIENYVKKIFSSPSSQAKRGTFTTKYKNSNRPELIIQDVGSRTHDKMDSKFATAGTKGTKITTKSGTPTKNASLHHQVSASLPSVSLFGGSIDDNDSDINFRMTDSIEIAINEYGAYRTQHIEDSIDLHHKVEDNDDKSNAYRGEEKKVESAVHSSYVSSSSNSVLVSQESSSTGMYAIKYYMLLFMCVSSPFDCCYDIFDIAPD